MSLLGNILWIVLGGGIFIFFQYLISGFFLCLTVIGIPFGIQCIKLSRLGLLPFGKTIRHTRSSMGCLGILMNIIWILIGGFWIAVTHLIFTFLCGITIIGIPFAKQHLKIAGLALTPFGKAIVRVGNGD